MDDLKDNLRLSTEARSALAGVYAGALTDLEVEALNTVAPGLQLEGDAFARAVVLARPLLEHGLAVALIEGLYDNGGAEDIEHTWLGLRLGPVDPSAGLLAQPVSEHNYMETSSETLYSVEDLDSALAWH